MLDETKEANQNEQNIETGNKTQAKTNKTKTQHDMCCTPLCTNTQKHNMICVAHHYAQTHTKTQ
jgi:hypothetical protein